MWNFDFKILIRIEDRVEGEKEKKELLLGNSFLVIVFFIVRFLFF
jgi:hypothetical protein